MGSAAGQALAVVLVLVVASAGFWVWFWRGELGALSSPRPRGGARDERNLQVRGRHRAARGVALAAVGAAVLTGCGHLLPGASPAPTASPPAVSSVSVGSVSLRVVAVFSTAKARVQGLQHRTIGPRDAAVFSWDGASASESFWMINTPQPLSLLWVAGGRVVGHVEMPRCAMSCPTFKPPAPYDTAVEAPGGAFADVRAGEAVSFS